MKAVLLDKVETIRKDLDKRTRSDGSASSGNWGHVGRPGKKGGSQKGGGSAFRMRKTVAKKYTSQAKIRKETLAGYKKALSSGNAKSIARFEKRMSRINMNIKSADISKKGMKGYRVIKKVDLNASRNILADPKRGKRARESTVSKITGTRAAIRYAFPNRTTRGGNKTRGGKTKETKSKV